MRYPLRDLDCAVAILEDEQLSDLQQLLNDEAYDAKSLDGIVWTVTPANTEREEYEVSGVKDLIALIKKSYCFHTCAGWGNIDSHVPLALYFDVGCTDVELYGYFAQD